MVSSLPVPDLQSNSPSTDREHGAGNPAVNMVVFHFPGVSEDTRSQDGTRTAADEGNLSIPNKQGGFSIISSSKSSNFAVVTPIQARSEASTKGFAFKKRDVGVKEDDSQLQKRAITITISPLRGLIRNSSVGKSFRTYVAKPAEKGYDRVSSNWNKLRNKMRANARKYDLDESYASYSPHGSQGWNGEHFYDERMRNDMWDD